MVTSKLWTSTRRIVLKLLKVAAGSAVLLAVSAVPVHADTFVAPYIGFNYGGNSNCAALTNCEDRRRNFGVSVGSMSSVVGFEADIGWAKDFFGKVPGAENSVFTLMSNVVIGPGARRVQPYFLAGVGLIRPHTSLNVATRSRRSRKTRSGTTSASASSAISQSRSASEATSAASKHFRTCRVFRVFQTNT